MQSDTKARGLELKIPPLALVFIAAGIMWLMARSFPRLQFGFPARTLLAATIAVAGAVIAASGVISFRRAKTTVNPMKPAAASSLVEFGIYSISRNPMYLGFFLLLVGWAIHLSNAAALVALPLFILYMNRFQIKPEEEILAALFGQAFEEYKSRVSRWL